MSGTSADSFKVNYLYALMAVVVALAVEHRSTDRMVQVRIPLGAGLSLSLSLSFLSFNQLCVLNQVPSHAIKLRTSVSARYGSKKIYKKYL